MSRETSNKIFAKLERLDEYLQHLKEIQKVNKKSFLQDYHFYGLAERYLQLTIEVLLDIGKLIILSQGFRRPENNQEIFEILREKKILSVAFTRRLDGISGFRNILVHDYEKIDRGLVYENLTKRLKDFMDFKKAIVIFLNKSIK